MTDLPGERARIGDAAFTDPSYRPGLVHHVVLFRFADGVDEEARAESERRFLALADSERDGRRYIRSIASGPQLSGEGSGHGFDLGFVVEFESLGDRNFYVGAPIVDDPAFADPAHTGFKAFVGPLLADVLVFDLQA